MRTVYKYSLSETHKIPHSAKLVHAGHDPHGELCAWYDVDTDNSPETIAFQVIGTGQEIPRGAEHVISTRDGPFIWHFYAIDGRASLDPTRQPAAEGTEETTTIGEEAEKIAASLRQND